MGVGAQRHAPAVLPPGMIRYPLYRRLHGPRGRSGRVRKISPSPGFDSRTVQIVASRYTNWAIPAHKPAVCWWSADHQQTRTPNTRRWHTRAATYCLIIQTQRTQISGRNSNGTKHSGGPPEDGREKIPKHVGFYTYKQVFNILLVLNVEVSVF